MKPTPSLSRPYGLAAAVLALIALAGCASLERTASSLSTLGGWVTPYKIDILQGNVVSREQAQALQVGMPREQVLNVLGTPLLNSAFHANRWDYVFTFQRQGQPAQQRRLTVFFQGDSLARVESDELPTEAEFVASLDVRPAAGKPLPLQATPEQLEAFRAKFPGAAPDAPAAPAAPAPATAYPPLENR
jgi:outer membrane protein assembly factor BamE